MTHPIKAMLFDTDGVLVTGGSFSKQLAQDYPVKIDALAPFFATEFKRCLVGELDLKRAIEPYLEPLGWNGSVDDLLAYWFKAEHKMDTRLLEEIQRLRASGIPCFMATNQERYRTEYLRTEMGFKTSLDGIFSSAELGYKKPQREFFQKILEKMSPILPEEIAYWDDTQANVDIASELGFKAFFYKDFSLFKEQLEFRERLETLKLS